MNFPFEKEIILENGVALLRPLEISDFNNLVSIATEDKGLFQFFPKAAGSETLLRDYLNNAIEERKNQSRYYFIIFDKRKNVFAGSTAFLNISNVDSRVEIGASWIGKDFQRTGLNRNCKFLLLSYAFEELGAERVELKTDERNTTSRNAIENIGGKFEGILRSHTLMHDGYRRNTVYYGILKNEWGHLKSNFKINKV